LGNTAHGEAATDHSNRHPIISQWNSYQFPLIPQMADTPDPTSDHYEAKNNNQENEDGSNHHFGGGGGGGPIGGELSPPVINA
jgi:hypothetical protein